MPQQFDDATIDTPDSDGIFMFIDEVNVDCKLNEAAGVICFGDDKQLPPHNITDSTLNEMTKRGATSLRMRLIK